MIPRLAHPSHENLPRPDFVECLAEQGFRGDIELDQAARTVFSTDNSIFQVKPVGILFPRDGDDLRTIARVASRAEFTRVVLTMRGGGTGTNGQSLTDGFVVDCSRHMTRILEIDPVRRIARVEAGVVKDQLNRALAPHGLFFAPELSTSNRATIGGMVSTDACGQGSCIYGKTSNHVLGLRVVLADGCEWWSRRLDPKALDAAMAGTGRIGEICLTLDRIERDNRASIERIFPKLNRYLTGYDLAHLRTEDGGLDVNAVLCGSEGTLAMIAEAELNLLPIPACAALINIRYSNFNAALEDARNLAALQVASVETVDETVLGLARGDHVWPEIAAYLPADGQGSANGINIVEVLGEDADEIEQKIAAVLAGLEALPLAGRGGHTVARMPEAVEAIWTMRKRAVGLLGNVEGPTRPVAFVEDTAVPPENLAAYIREFRALLDAEGLSYGMFGHVDAGVLHVRPALDLTRPEHERLVRRVSDAVVALTRKHGGVLWGEHGKGMRSEYVPEVFGPLYPCLQEIKRAFDPRNQLNPGKIALPEDGELKRIDTVPLRGALDRAIGAEIRAAFDNAAYCNGNGACFDFSETSLMCPSYKGSRDRRHSPKGRASLVREWLRLLALAGVDPRVEAEQVRRTHGLPAFLARAWNSLSPANRDDFSHEVHRAMDTCLSCKACAGQCPVKVDVPAFRAKFLELYHGRYLRPVKDPLVASIENLLPWLGSVRPAYNAFVGSGIGRRLMGWAGLTAMPTLGRLSLKRELRRRGVAFATPELVSDLSANERSRTVVFVQDAFTSHFDCEVVLDAVNLARKLGFIVLVSELRPNGKALHVHGYLRRFEEQAARNAAYLAAIGQPGVTLVGLDPSMTLTYRGEYKQLAGIATLPDVLLPQEWLSSHSATLRPRIADTVERRFRLFLHCTERSQVPAAARQWIALFRGWGVEVVEAQVGCCGMAGTFGHEVRNRALSEEIYTLSWKPALEGAAGGDDVMATGYSCRSQVKLMEGRAPRHPLQVLNALIPDGAGSLSLVA